MGSSGRVVRNSICFGICNGVLGAANCDDVFAVTPVLLFPRNAFTRFARAPASGNADHVAQSRRRRPAITSSISLRIVHLSPDTKIISFLAIDDPLFSHLRHTPCAGGGSSRPSHHSAVSSGLFS